MKFKIREGFKLFNSVDDAISFETMGTRSGVQPKAQGGDTVNLTALEVQQFAASGILGKLIPLDAEAIEHFGNTRPIVSRLITHPAEFAVPVPSTASTTTEIFEPVYKRSGRA
jgi:hypothetical protein